MTTVKLLVLDIDGVLTDGRIFLDATGEFCKPFDVRDGCAIKLWRHCGGQVALLSGRDSRAVHRRAAELGVTCVHAGVENKTAGYETIVTDGAYRHPEVAYVGDDLPDLGPMERCGVPVAVANAVPVVKRTALYVTRRPGGNGAVGEVVELLLRMRGLWSPALLRDF
ncbi:MAG: HAD hydrolase family protein [Phycisphaerae bacterium]|jgi:3-deoxy-D-manno-octulosonate 8-phosphate phosphatase (KDO 8-P phosphatase)